MLAAANSAAVNAAATLFGMARNMSSFLCELHGKRARSTSAGRAAYPYLTGLRRRGRRVASAPRAAGSRVPNGTSLSCVDHIGQARAAFGQVGRVDLGDVAQA